MSYDLMVFDVAAAPKDRTAFREWYDKQTQWTEGHSYNDPKVSTPSLRAWFLEMIQEFPALNGPFAGNIENEKITDYSVGNVVIYAAFGCTPRLDGHTLKQLIPR